MQLGAVDRGPAEFRQRLRCEAELVAGHAGALEANTFPSDLLEGRLAELQADER